MPIKDKWYLIGVSLEVNTGDLESLNTSNSTTAKNLSVVINKWLEEKSNEATWKALLKEVEGPIVNNHQIGDNIRTFLRKLKQGIQLINLPNNINIYVYQLQLKENIPAI